MKARTMKRQEYAELLESRLRIKAEDVPVPLSPDEGAIYNQGWMDAIRWALEMLPEESSVEPAQ